MSAPAITGLAELRAAWTPGGSVVLLRRINPPLPSPRELFRALPQKAGNVLLDSQSGPDEFARHSILAFDPFLRLDYSAGKWTMSGANRADGQGNPFPLIQSLLDERAVANSADLPFCGGAIGYLGYDLVRLFEHIPAANPDPLAIPDLVLFFFDRFLVWDRTDGSWTAGVRLACSGDPIAVHARGVAELDRLAARVATSVPVAQPACAGPPTIRFLGDEQSYLDRVEQIIRYIRDGEVYQANYSQRCEVRCPGLRPWELFERLSAINPAPFAAYLDMGNFQIASNSPERLVAVRDRIIWDRPLAGTARKTQDATIDEQFRLLVSDPKEAAEHRMLVDLERNDLGRVCQYGSINVLELMVPEVCSHLLHICSNISGALRPNVRLFDILRAVFPGGTITGVPKVRCMEILEELESYRRSLFYGSIGLLSYDGQIQLSILIRTILAQAGLFTFQVGGGIVADSRPAKEYQESRLKAEAMLQAITECCR